jgi:rhamnose utilization protein RhaD (predicted bifunctional aldolase and dehydrogenase)
MDRSRLAQIWKKSYPRDPKEREAAVLADMLAAKKPGEEQKRPSVETLLHDILPFTYVIHTHPPLVNGLTCSVEAEGAAVKNFGHETVWIPSTNPGYILSKKVKDALDAFTAARGSPPSIILLQNHGVFVAADTAGGIRAIYERILDTLGAGIKRYPDFSGKTGVYHHSGEVAGILGELAAKTESSPGKWPVLFERIHDIAAFVQDRPSFYPLSSSYTPDHIVYAGSDPLFIETKAAPSPALKEHIRTAWQNHLDKIGRIPKIVALEGMGIFALGASEKAAHLALELFTDVMKVAVYTLSFGGPRFMVPDQIEFINTWEAEHYRSKISG